MCQWLKYIYFIPIRFIVKHFFGILLLIFFIAAGKPLSAQTITDEECMKFHHGTFVDGSLSYIEIVRDSIKNTQTETDTRTGKYSTYKITWLNACTYELDLIKSTDKQQRKASKAMGTLRVQITSFDDDGYSYIATALTLPGPLRGTVKWKKS
jgi:hypothetical protein